MPTGAEIAVRRFYDALNRGDDPDLVLAELQPMLHPAAEYVNPPDAVEPGTARGPEGWKRVLMGVFEGLGPTSEFRVHEVVERGERAFARISIRTGGGTSGIEVAGPTIGAVFTLRDGLLVRLEWCWDPRDALALFEGGG